MGIFNFLVMVDNNKVARKIVRKTARKRCCPELSDKDMFDGAFSMAEWKDRRVKTIITDIVSNILIDTEYTEGKIDACSEIYERLFGEKLTIRGGAMDNSKEE